MIRIVLADDHNIVRSGLKDILARDCEFELIGEAASGDELIGMLHHIVPDLLLTDLSMPGNSGIGMIKRIGALHPGLPVLVLTMCNDAQMAMRILKAGASGYITKDCLPEQLIAAVHKVANGGKYIDTDLAEAMIFDCTGEGMPHEKLSNRELDIFRLLLQGMRVNAISDELCLSEKTVSSHKINIMRKLGMGNMTELVRYAVQHGLFFEDIAA